MTSSGPIPAPESGLPPDPAQDGDATDEMSVAMRRLFSTILRRLLIALAALAVISLGAGYAWRGSTGLYGAALALGLGALFIVTTVLVMRATADRHVYLASAAAVGSWLVKMVIVLIVLLAVRDRDFYDGATFLITLGLVVVVSAAIEIGGIATARIPYVNPKVGRVTRT
ncbi:MAG: hypothetical protein Q4P36_04355 [Bowdeniella nasicola]|nr:hypothetical protein [Bowdeniella nasicola]